MQLNSFCYPDLRACHFLKFFCTQKPMIKSSPENFGTSYYGNLLISIYYSFQKDYEEILIFNFIDEKVSLHIQFQNFKDKEALLIIFPGKEIYFCTLQNLILFQIYSVPMSLSQDELWKYFLLSSF